MSYLERNMAIKNKEPPKRTTTILTSGSARKAEDCIGQNFKFGLIFMRISKKKEKLPASELIRLFDCLSFGQFYKYAGRPGAYIIFSAENGKCKPIARHLAIDKEGILYIGGSMDIFNRLYVLLKKSIEDNCSAHPFGKKYNSQHRARELYPIHSLCVCIIPSETPYKLEKELKVEYEQRCGEYPPYNLN